MDNIIINLDDGLTLGNGGLPNLSEQADIISQSDTMVGPAGPQGPAGPAGKDGQAATITVGTTTTGAAGTNAQVQNSGTSSAAVLDFTIPRGERGETGATGATGATGPAGQDGQDGEAATITVGSVQTVAPEYPATVTNSGTTSAAVLDFEIPRGLTGETGPAGADGRDGTDGRDGQDGADGQAATIAVGTTTTGAAGTNASVTNSGTSSAAVFNFTIPRGDTGATGQNGTDGADGFSPTATVTQNTGSATISITDKNGTTTATVYDGVTPDISVTSYSLSSTPAHSGGTNSYSINKQLNMVTMNVQSIWTNAVTTSWVTIGTIVSDIRPSATISCVGTVVEGSNGTVVAYGKVQVQNDGNIRFRANAAYTGLSAYGFSITWVI